MGKLAKKFALGAIIAGAVGYIAGILTAPKSGQETRQDIKNEVTKRLTEAEKELKSLLVDLNKAIDDAKNLAERFTGTARKELDELLNVAKDTKEKARKVLSAVHEGDAEDKDLNSAIKDANAAIDRLKDFLKK